MIVIARKKQTHKQDSQTQTDLSMVYIDKIH